MIPRRSYISAVAMAAAIAASGSILGAPVASSAPKSFPSWKHDPDRLAAAEAKRVRKNAKRLALLK